MRSCCRRPRNRTDPVLPALGASTLFHGNNQCPGIAGPARHQEVWTKCRERANCSQFIMNRDHDGGTNPDARRRAPPAAGSACGHHHGNGAHGLSRARIGAIPDFGSRGSMQHIRRHDLQIVPHEAGSSDPGRGGVVRGVPRRPAAVQQYATDQGPTLPHHLEQSLADPA